MTGFNLLAPDQFHALPDGRRLCFRSHGAAHADPLILVIGLGLQLTYWPQPMIDGLVRNGFRVITMDNRDAGLSSFTDVRPPTLLQQFFRRADPDGYDLGDMADDVIALMDGLNLSAAHLLGMSMGGMIAQTVAARYPGRVRSLVSIFSTTGSLRVGQPALRAILQLMRHPAQSRDESASAYVDAMRLIGSSLEWDEEEHRTYAEHAWDRGGGVLSNLGTARQIGAIINSGDRTAELRNVRCRTLVIHGERDHMVASSGGYATAAAISGAKLVILPGLGHALPHTLLDTLLSLLVGHLRSS